jgi:uncharacterized SAM-binding protein YcdF (DUF218 family)
MKTLVETLGIPPVAFALLMLAGLTLRGRWYRSGVRVTWVGLIGLILLGMPAVSSALLTALETGLPTTPPADKPPQAIIVLGAEIALAPEEKLGGLPGELTLQRLRTAAELHRRTSLPVLVSGGPMQQTLPPLAVIMDRSLNEDFGTPPKWVEAKSADTLENARFSAAMLKEAGITSAYVVTHAWHMRRAIIAFRDTGLTVTAVPVATEHMLLGLEPMDFLPHASGWQAGYCAIREWAGYGWYLLRLNIS